MKNPLYRDGFCASRHYVYFVVCQDPEIPETAYLKVGISVDPLPRLRQIRVGSPLPILRASYVQTPGKRSALRVEAEILEDLSAFATRGEWVRIRWSEADHRRRVFEVIELVLNERLRSWEFIEIDLDAAFRCAVEANRQAQQRRERYASYRKRRRVAAYEIIAES